MSKNGLHMSDTNIDGYNLISETLHEVNTK
jgi:hypothetical protein